jgi:hypothetical protein
VPPPLSLLLHGDAAGIVVVAGPAVDGRQLLVGLRREPTRILPEPPQPLPDRDLRDLIERYARRVTIEQRLAGGDSQLPRRRPRLPGASQRRPRRRPLRARGSGVCLAAPPARRLRDGHTRHPAAPLPLTGGTILNRGDEIVVQLARRTYSPGLRAADLPEVVVPWWQGRRLRFEFA